MSELRDEKGFDSKFQFMLTADGFQIKQSKGVLTVEDEALQQNGHTQIQQGRASAKFKGNWLLKPEQEREDFPFFFLELEDGDQPPRITCPEGEVLVTTRVTDGYNDREKSVWQISKYQQ